jgi:hypothetical protein
MRLLQREEAAALRIPVASPVLGDVRDVLLLPPEANANALGGERVRSRAIRQARWRPKSLVVDADGEAVLGSSATDGAVHDAQTRGGARSSGGVSGGGSGDEANLHACMRLLWSLVACFASAVCLPAVALGFPATVLFTMTRSMRKNVLVPLGVLWWERTLFAANYILLLGLLAVLMAIVFAVGPRQAALGNVSSAAWVIGGMLLATSVPVWAFLASTNTHRYWNRVPGGLTRTYIRFTFANLRTVVALLFTTLQLASFPVARLAALSADADRRAGGSGNSTAPLAQLPGFSQLSPSDLATVYAEIDQISTYVVGLLPFFDFFTILMWVCIGAVALWLIWLAVPVTQQLLLVWWIGALQLPPAPDAGGARSSSSSGGGGVSSSASTALQLAKLGGQRGAGNDGRSRDAAQDDDADDGGMEGGAPGEASANGRALDPEQAQDMLNQMAERDEETGGGGGGDAGAGWRTFARAAAPRMSAVVEGAAPAHRQRTWLSQLAFDLARGRYFARYLYGQRVHGFMQYLLGDLFYVSITSNLLRTVNCRVACVSPGVCTATLYSQPSQVCWTSSQHQLMAGMGMSAFLVYIYTATFASSLMVDVLDRGDTLDIRTTPRFEVTDRIVQLTVLACYILVDPLVAVSPVAIQAALMLAMVIYVERTRPGSDRTILLRSCLFQINLCVAVAALTAYTRVPWLPLVLMGGSIVLVLLITMARYIPLSRRLGARDLRYAIHGLGSADDNLDDEGLVRVRGQDQQLLHEANAALAAGEHADAIAKYKRAVLYPPTQNEAAVALALMAYEARYMPRYLLNTLRICQVFLSRSPSSTRLTGHARQTMRVLRFACEWELNEVPTERFVDMLAWLHGMRERNDGKALATAHAWCLLGLMYERVGTVGVQGLVRRRDRVLFAMKRTQYYDLARTCMERGAKVRGGHAPTLHLARYLLDGIGGDGKPDFDRALDLLAYLVQQGYRRAYWFMGVAWWYRVLVSTTVPQGTRDLWHAWAYDAWRFGALAGDYTCHIRAQQLPPRPRPLLESSLPRAPGQLEAFRRAHTAAAPHAPAPAPARTTHASSQQPPPRRPTEALPAAPGPSARHANVDWDADAEAAAAAAVAVAGEGEPSLTMVADVSPDWVPPPELDRDAATLDAAAMAATVVTGFTDAVAAWALTGDGAALATVPTDASSTAAYYDPDASVYPTADAEDDADGEADDPNDVFDPSSLHRPSSTYYDSEP